MHKVNRGLRLPIRGEPAQEIDTARAPGRVALVAADYVGMRPTMQVVVGDTVKRGQLLFEDKKMPGVRYTSPGAGKVVAVNRGERRALQSVVVDLARSETEGRSGAAEEQTFGSFTGKPPSSLTGSQVEQLLIESGMWTALRARPFSKVATPETRPRSIFVTAIDTQPLAPAVGVVLQGKENKFQRGLTALTKLTEGAVYVCVGAGEVLELPDEERVRREEFSGPHPAGTAGFHIHTLDPVDRNKTVWHIGYQDVIAIGHLLETGKLDVERIVSLAGPVVKKPRLLRTRIGASIDDLVAGELDDGDNRVISGSVLAGRSAMGDVLGYLGRYHQQITAMAEGREREFMGWMAPGAGKYSTINTFVSALMPGKKFAFTTSTNGSLRAVVPIGMYEKVMPMDIEPTYLLKSLLMHDIEMAEEFGCLELDEEDLALCTFVCPGKNDYGPYLREVLTTIEKEG
ncbi:MAG: Na(+)-translocating NADH-quinone reductase subunit A [Acidobacteria bacterium]|nr:MAG: Na(+)-translocating NADH-quinone reductase subunit A [Acidobacteriota bacterium]